MNTDRVDGPPPTRRALPADGHDFGVSDQDAATRFAIDFYRIETKGSLL